jgi:hypothetical protein
MYPTIHPRKHSIATFILYPTQNVHIAWVDEDTYLPTSLVLDCREKLNSPQPVQTKLSFFLFTSHLLPNLHTASTHPPHPTWFYSSALVQHSTYSVLVGFYHHLMHCTCYFFLKITIFLTYPKEYSCIICIIFSFFIFIFYLFTCWQKRESWVWFVIDQPGSIVKI